MYKLMDAVNDNVMPEKSEELLIIDSLFDKGHDKLEYKGLQTYFLPAPEQSDDKMARRKGKKAGRKPASAAVDGTLNTGITTESLESERYTLKVLEGILREKEEMLALHEQKLISLREDYEKKLAGAGSGFPGDVSSAKGLEIAKMNEEHELLGSLILERKSELEKLRDEEMRLQVAMSKHMRDITDHQKQFDRLQKAISQLDSHARKKQNELDEVSYKLDMKRKEYEQMSREASAAKKELAHVQKSLTHDIESEIKVLAKRVDDHLRHDDYERARNDYLRIRELYAKLSRSEKLKVYEKVAKVAAELT